MNFLFSAKMTEEMLVGIFISAVVVLVLSIVYYVGYWCLLQKMGRHDFAAIVPGYAVWEYGRGAGLSCGLSWILVLGWLAYSILGATFLTTFGYEGFWNDFWYAFMFAGDGGAGALDFATELLKMQFAQFNPHLYCFLLAAVFFLVLNLYASYGVARSFDHGIAFMLGLVIVPFVFVPLLGGSSAQTYQGPYLDQSQQSLGVQNWTVAVEARLDAFGSNAPFALALVGMMLGAVCVSLPGIALSIIALVRNRYEKDKPLSRPKYSATLAIGWLGILISIAVPAVVLALGLLTNAVYSL